MNEAKKSRGSRVSTHDLYANAAGGAADRATYRPIQELPAETFVPRKSSRNGALVFSSVLFFVAFAVVELVFYLAMGRMGIASTAVALVIAALAVSSVHIALNWEKVVILRFGKLARVAGPGLYFTIPVIEHGTIRVDQRTMATPFNAERTLTADLVPITVDAVLFWVVWDAEKACNEVEDYFSAVSFLAQTALREAVGRKTVAEVAISRDELDVEIKREIERISANWGVDVIDVKVRDIVIPRELQDVMSLEAQAERERDARMAVATIETDLAEILKEAADIYNDSDAAMKLRSMLMQYETVKKSGGTVVTVPSAVSDGFINPAGK